MAQQLNAPAALAEIQAVGSQHPHQVPCSRLLTLPPEDLTHSFGLCQQLHMFTCMRAHTLKNKRPEERRTWESLHLSLLPQGSWVIEDHMGPGSQSLPVT